MAFDATGGTITTPGEGFWMGEQELAFQFSTAARNGALDAIETAVGTSPILKIRTGAAPASSFAAGQAFTVTSFTINEANG